jgi:hypothetical protein
VSGGGPDPERSDGLGEQALDLAPRVASGLQTMRWAVREKAGMGA